MNKGFITLAIGDYYYQLAEHLVTSYRLFGNCNYPFYIITDKKGKEYLQDSFDGYIIKDSFTKTSLDDIIFFTDNPFNESIFIDADCSIVNDIAYIFNLFEENGSEISGISGYKELKEGECGIQFGRKSIEKFNLKYDFPNFNGGVYYYNQSETGRACVQFMINELLPNYHKYELLGSGNNINMDDEPLVIVSMIKNELKTISQSFNVMYLVHDANNVKWDMKNKKCNYKYYDIDVSPTIIHWKFGGTENINYKYYDAKLYFYYDHKIILYIYRITMIFIKYRVYPKLLRFFPFLHNIVDKVKKR